MEAFFLTLCLYAWVIPVGQSRQCFSIRKWLHENDKT